MALFEGDAANHVPIEMAVLLILRVLGERDVPTTNGWLPIMPFYEADCIV